MRLPPAVVPADCPACKRYIGRATVCPYCDVDIPVPRRVHLIRLSAFVLAIGGLLLLWLAATGMSGDTSRRVVIILPDLPSRLYTVLAPHLHWMLWCGSVLLLLTEPPQPVTAGQAGWRGFLAANRPTVMATLVFLLAGLLGFILMRAAPRSPGIILLGLIPAAGIAALPRLYGVRYRNTLGLLLLPLACDLSGLAPALADLLRLQ